MKSLKVQMFNSLSIVAMLMAGAAFTACTSDELVPEQQQTPAVENTYTLTVNATKGGDEANTRALSLVGKTLNAAWAEGEEVTVFNVTKDADLTGTLVAQSSGTSTTLKGSLTGTIEAGDVLKLKFLSPDYTSQAGTLEYIAANCDYAEANVNVSAVSGGTITTTSATFTNQQAIVKFTLKNKADDSALSASVLTVSDGTNTVTVTPASATSEVYVAIPGFSSKTVTLTANAGDDYYLFSQPSVTFANSQYYAISVKMETSDLAAPLTFEAKTAGATVTFNPGGHYDDDDEWVPVQLQYSTDGITWATYSSPVTLTNVGDRVSFREKTYGMDDVVGSFSCSADCYIYGNIMSLINSIDYVTTKNLTTDCTFAGLFMNNPAIFSHPSKKMVLPATTLTVACYSDMFNGCTGLTEAPELPATTLAEECYMRMFQGCISLTKAPLKLLATSMATECCVDMFKDCTSLIVAPELPATILADNCYAAMFSGCTNLTIAPEVLPAPQLTRMCYFEMFKDCTNLTIAPDLSATIHVSDLSCFSMFSGCSSLTTAPVLPTAKILYMNSYTFMFSGCSNLNSVKCLATNISATSCTSNWLDGVSATGTFTKAAGVEWPSGASGIPEGWTVVEE